MPSVFLFRLYPRNCYILFCPSACARLRHPREQIWRGKRTFHNRYRVLKVLVSWRSVNFPFTTKISTGFVLYIYIYIDRILSSPLILSSLIRRILSLVGRREGIRRRKINQISFHRLAIQPPLAPSKFQLGRTEGRFYSSVFPSWRIDRLTINSNHTARWLLITNKIPEPDEGKITGAPLSTLFR